MTHVVRNAGELREHVAAQSDGDMDAAAFRAQFSELVARLPDGVIAEHAFFTLPGNIPPWHDTGMDCAVGDDFSIFCVGRIWMSRPDDVWLKPALWLWYRIGVDGEAFRGTRNSHGFTADTAGRFHLGGTFPGEWSGPTGTLDDTGTYAQTEGEVCVLVIRWVGDGMAGLRALRQLGDVGGMLTSELARRQTRIPLPDDWFYPWHVGPAEAYVTDPMAQRPRIIGCYTHQDATTLRKDVVLPFKPGTRLRWSWKMDELPSKIREDHLFTHDYLSLAVEFDNGRDLAYYWSAELPAETAYACPIPKWADKETHVVLRSGHMGLGAWFDEDRDVYADYRRWIGAPPARIVRIWFIALSLFGRGEGRCEYGGMELVQDGKVIVIN